MFKIFALFTAMLGGIADVSDDFSDAIVKRVPVLGHPVVSSTLIMVIGTLLITAFVMGVDPTLGWLQAMGTVPALLSSIALIVTGALLLDHHSDKFVRLVSMKVKALGLPILVVALVVAFGTSSSELGLVIVSLQNADYVFLAHSIVGSDQFQLGPALAMGLMMTPALVATGRRFLGNGIALYSENNKNGRMIVPLALIFASTLTILWAAFVGFSILNMGLTLAFALSGAFLFLIPKKNGEEEEETKPKNGRRRVRLALYLLPRVILSLALLMWGATLFYNGLTVGGGLIGIPDSVLGYAGAVVSSLPEVFTMKGVILSLGLMGGLASLAQSNGFDTSFMALAGLAVGFVVPGLVPMALYNVVTSGSILLAILLLKRFKVQSVPKRAGYVLFAIHLVATLVIQGMA